MRKRSWQTSAHNSHELDSEIKEEENNVSQLPDDILIEILSRLTLKQAAKASLVSSNWKSWWTFNKFLDFDAPRKRCKVENLIKRTELEGIRIEYINWVNKVLELHRGSNISLFRICFSLTDHHKSSITNWINFAMAKKVQHLELNLSGFQGWGETPYRFPHECYKRLRTAGGLGSIRLLKSLCFVNVHVSRNILEFFIHNCPVLEQLRLDNIRYLSRLKVVGSSIRLKHLEVCHCLYLEEIEISAPSILSFKYYGSSIKLNVENVPQLVDVSISGEYFTRPEVLVEPFAKYLPQLETLELDLPLDKVNLLLPVPILPKLRRLIFSVSAHDSKNLLDLTLVMKECPFMQKFTLKLLHTGRSRRRIIHPLPKWPYQHLKVVEFFGFQGHAIDLEFAFHLLENAAVLEKMIINPISMSSLGSYQEFKGAESERAAARMCAKQLQEMVPQGVELVIH